MNIDRFLKGARGRRILVVGDVMLDAYVSGEATRISPEAPVPVVAVSKRRYVPGGAANVAANICSLGAKAFLAGVTGVDEPAALLNRELKRLRIDASPLVADDQRITTTKTRITAGGQQIVRVDEENTSPLSDFAAGELQTRCETLLDDVHAVIISDYAKGVAGESLCQWLIVEARRRNKPVVVDPKSKDLRRYRGATVITPNLKEAGAAAGETIHSADELAEAASVLLEKIAPSALLVTRGGEGMSLFEPDQSYWQTPALNIEVADVTGAGDTVVAALAIALAQGFTLREGAEVANIAAGQAVRHPGTHAIRPHELRGRNRALFLDRDGTIIRDFGYMKSPDEIQFLPNAPRALARLAAEGWKLIIISNQSGIGRNLITPEEADEVQSAFVKRMEAADAPVTASYICAHTPDEHCECRKPLTFSVERAAREHSISLADSWMIGDRESDILCGKVAGCSTIWLRNPEFAVDPALPDLTAANWTEIHNKLSMEDLS
jgi:rfaE bifunctional protein kinase chain/domain